MPDRKNSGCSNDRLQAFAMDKLHDKITPPTKLPGIMRMDNIWMVQTGNNFYFSLEMRWFAES